jgi:hypothetical protein
VISVKNAEFDDTIKTTHGISFPFNLRFMPPFDEIDLRTHAAAALNQREHRHDGARVVDSLAEGLRALRSLLCLRLREDVERNFGLDSMNLPASAVETERRLEREVDVYQAAVAALHARERGYLRGDIAWSAEWLVRLRRGDYAHTPECRGRIVEYLALSRQEQRLLFTNALIKILPETSRAPLVLFRLFPVSVRAGTSTAFGDAAAAEDLRTQQKAILPAIEDCPQCRAAVLDNGQVCPTCSNPLWTYDYLTTAD